MSLNLVTAPAVEPLSVQEVKDHLRAIDDGNAVEDALLEQLIVSVRQSLDGRDGMLNRQLITATWDYTVHEFPRGISIDLPLAPVQSIDSISYVDADGATQTWASSNYTLSADLDQRPRVYLEHGKSWPGTRDDPDAVTIRFDAGYGGAASDVPAPIRAAMLLLIGNLYNSRESTVIGTIVSELPMGVEALLSPYYRFRHV